jgi:hypothetical protein
MKVAGWPQVLPYLQPLLIGAKQKILTAIQLCDLPAMGPPKQWHWAHLDYSHGIRAGVVVSAEEDAEGF